MDDRPLISIVVAVRNGARTLQRCIDSVSEQTYPNRELIVIDGASDDGTLELLKNSGAKISYWLSEPDRGVFDAWNKGLAHARGEWTCFIGADDYLWSADVLEELAPHLTAARGRSRIVYCRCVMVDSEGKELDRLGRPWPEIKRRFPYVMGVPHPATFYHREVFRSHGTFDTSFRIAGDFEFLLRELGASDALFVPEVISTGMQEGGISSDGANSLTVLKEMRIAQKRHGYAVPGLEWIKASARVRLRLCLWECIGSDRSAAFLDWGRRVLGRQPYWTRVRKPGAGHQDRAGRAAVISRGTTTEYYWKGRLAAPLHLSSGRVVLDARGLGARSRQSRAPTVSATWSPASSGRTSASALRPRRR